MGTDRRMSILMLAALRWACRPEHAWPAVSDSWHALPPCLHEPWMISLLAMKGIEWQRSAVQRQAVHAKAMVWPVLWGGNASLSQRPCLLS